MSGQAVVLLNGVGAALLALWLEVRFGHGPRTVRATLTNAGAALLLTRCLPILLTAAVGDGQSQARKMAGILLVMLPGLTYIWLSSIWLMKLAQRRAHLS
jgi:hypothetical protein